ncbi:oxamate carbamoyltransferase subunit AllH family protein [Bradyrhizobium embrapense]
MLIGGSEAHGRQPGRVNAPGERRPEPGVIVPAAVEVGLLADRALRDRAVGQVVAMFERSLYAVIDGIWICVGRTGIGSGPLHVVGDFRWPSLAVGDPVRVADSILWIGATPFANLATRSVWAPPAVPNWSISSLRRGLDAVDEVWVGGLIAEGLAAVGSAHAPSDTSALVRAAMPGLAALERVLAGADDDADREPGLASLIGLGPGLTPSGDDLIGGALIALATFGRNESRDALWDRCRMLLDGTNDISRMHLRAAALGYGAAALHAAIHTTMSGETAGVRGAVTALAAIGHTSGLDAFAGGLIVLRHALCQR